LNVELTNEQKVVLDDMVARRIRNTNESEEEARRHVREFFEARLRELEGDPIARSWRGKRP
jgi:hypothetical protein